MRYLEPKPLAELVQGDARPVDGEGPIRLPVLGRGADVAAVYAREHGLFEAAGVDVELVPGNDFVAQVTATLAGESPYLRGTAGMILAAAEVFARAGIELVVVDHLGASTGADALVARPGVASPSTLAGKTIALQRHGAHVAFFHDLLRRAGVPAEKVEPRWLAEPTLPAADVDDGAVIDAASAFVADDSLDAVLVAVPDALALTSGGEVGSGAAGSVRGARIVATTEASRPIVELYAVRGDWLADHGDRVAAVARALAEARAKLAGAAARDSAFLTRAGETLFGSPYAAADVAVLLAGNELATTAAGKDFFVRDLPRLGRDAGDALAAFGLDRPTAELAIPARFRAEPARRAEGDPTKSGSATVPTTVASATPASGDDTMAEGSPGAVRPAAGDEPTAGDKPEIGSTAADDDPTAGDDDSRTESALAARRADGQPAGDEPAGDEPATADAAVVATIPFAPDRASFAAERHAASFERIHDALRRRPGARVLIEGHVDGRRLAVMADGATPLERHLLAQQARNLGLRRAQAVRAGLLLYCAERDAATDGARFVAVGHGATDGGEGPGAAVVIRIESPAAADGPPESAP